MNNNSNGSGTSKSANESTSTSLKSNVISVAKCPICFTLRTDNPNTSSTSTSSTPKAFNPNLNLLNDAIQFDTQLPENLLTATKSTEASTTVTSTETQTSDSVTFLAGNAGNAVRNRQELSLAEMGYTIEDRNWNMYVDPPNKTNMKKILKKTIMENFHPDLKIYIGKWVCDCHRIVLQPFTSYFDQFAQGVPVELPADKVTPKIFTLIYAWILEDAPLERRHILELLRAAEFLEIDILCKHIWAHLDQPVYAEDIAFEMLVEAKACGLNTVVILMLPRIRKYFLNVVASDHFLQLSSTELYFLLQSDAIGVNFEEEVFMSAMHWLNFKWPEREAKLPRLMNCIRFPLLPVFFVVKQLMDTTTEIYPIIQQTVMRTMLENFLLVRLPKNLHNDDNMKNEFPQNLARLRIYDKECKYHKCTGQHTPGDNFTYEDFKEQLIKIRSIGNNYWRTLEIIDVGKINETE